MGDKYWQWIRVGQDGQIKWASSLNGAHFAGVGHDLSSASDNDDIWVWVGVYKTSKPCPGMILTKGVVEWCRMYGAYWNIFTDPEKFEEANW